MNSTALEASIEWLDEDHDDGVVCATNNLTKDKIAKLSASIAKEKAAKVERAMNKAMTHWMNLGLPAPRREARLKELEEFIDSCLGEIEQIEDEMFQRFCLYRTKKLDEIQKMLKDLHLPQYEANDSMTLFQLVRCLKTKHKELDSIKQERMARLDRLRSRQAEHCQVLDIKAPPVLKMLTDIPSDDELMQLQAAVNDLEKEIKRRRDKHACLKDMITALVDQLEWTSRNDFELQIIQDKPDKSTLAPLSEEYLKRMQVFHQDLEERYAKNQKEYEKLEAKLKGLYNRLETSDEERQAFLSTHCECRPTIMESMRQEIVKLEELKKQNIGRFIEKIRDELVVEYDRCFIAQEERDRFMSLASTNSDPDYCEEILELHEKELERVQGYYESNRLILEKFQKWQEMWLKLIEFETRANDPNRLNNRGGQLLIEERQRKSLQKNLPKVEKELMDMCEKYSKENGGRKFKILDSDLDVFIAGCWDELHQAKESEKRERQLAKTTAANQPAARGAPAKPLLRCGNTTGGPQASISIRSTPVKRIAGKMVTPTPTKIQCRGIGTMGTPLSARPIGGGVRPMTSSSVKKRPVFNPHAKGGLASNANFTSSTLSLNEEEFENAIQSCHTSGKRLK